MDKTSTEYSFIRHKKKFHTFRLLFCISLSVCLLITFVSCSYDSENSHSDKYGANHTEKNYTENGGTNNNSGGTTYYRETCNLTIFSRDGSSTQITAYVGQNVKVDVPSYTGLYLTGIFDSQVGGTAYFDSMGRSKRNWSTDFPSTLYCQYGSIENLCFESQHFYDSTGTEVEYSCDGDTVFEFISNDEFLCALKWNPNATIKFTVNYLLRGTVGPYDNIVGGADFYYYMYADDNTEIFVAKKIECEGNSYIAKSESITFPAKKMEKGSAYFSTCCSNFNYPFYIKDVYATIEFILED